MKRIYKFIQLYVSGFLIYLISFLSLYYIKYTSLIFTPTYILFLLAVLLSWFISSLLTGKYKSTANHIINSSASLYKELFTSFFLMLGILSLFSLLADITNVSRYIIVGSLLLGLLLEILQVSLFTKKERQTSTVIHLNISLTPIITELVTLIYVFAIILFIGLKYDLAQVEEVLVFSGVLLSWFISSVFSHQFEFSIKEKYWRLFWRYQKSYIIFGALVSFLLFLLRIEWKDSLYIIAGVLLFSILSLMTLSFIFISRKPAKVDEVKTKLVRATEWVEERFTQKKVEKFQPYGIKDNMYNHYLAEQLSSIYLKRFPPVYIFLEQNLDLLSFDFRKCVMIRSADTYNVEVLPDSSLELYMNLHQINDMRRINVYLILLNSKLEDGGVFIGCLQPNYLRFKQFLKDYPSYLARFFFFFDFLWKRLLPKLPVLKKIYFALTKGKKRALSLAEGLGRLYYCGFEVLGLKSIDEYVYFIAKKVKPPLEDIDPSYGPLIKLKRTGKNGKLIHVYKLRTMHPYSEYLQQFVYDINELEEGGKLKDDFRVTGWGRYMRKLWLDELPMYINFFKRELKLVGVRPLSRHYLSLYRDDLIERRKKYKPGLVPPFYVDLPKTLEEIMKSEEKYMDAYDKNPVLTDVRYFIKAWYNILVRKARSG